MGCCVFACIGAIWPRITLVVMWLINYAPGSFRTWYWPLLGFFFLPATTLVYKLAIYYRHGQAIESSAWAMVALGVAFLHDLGQLGMVKWGKGPTE